MPSESSSRTPAAVATAAETVLYVPGSRARATVEERLTATRGSVVTATSLAGALEQLTDGHIDVCLIDLMDGRTAVPLLRMVHSQHPTVPIVAIADPANPAMAAEALYSGAVDVLPWPFEDQDLLTALANAAESSGVVFADDSTRAPRVYMYSPAMRHAMEQVEAAASLNTAVSLFGEPGTGRLLLARALHIAAHGSRADDAAFRAIDCEGVGPQAIERALFGSDGSDDASAGGDESVERLGRTGAIGDAIGGTLVLRNLAEAPARVQARLARLLRDREARLGGKGQVVELDLRAVAIFSLDAESQVDDGQLRRDLFERFTTCRIDVPPLRRRREDIPVLAAHLMATLSRDAGRSPRYLSRSAMALLAALPWRENVPELRRLLETLVTGSRKAVVHLDHILEHAQLDGLGATIDPGVTLRDAKARFERDCISAVLMRHHGRVGEAAKALGIQRTNLYRKVRQLNVARSLLSARR